MKSGKSRHFGRDAEIQAMDGNQQVVQVLDSGDLPVPRAQWRRKPRIAPHGGAWRGNPIRRNTRSTAIAPLAIVPTLRRFLTHSVTGGVPKGDRGNDENLTNLTG